MTPKNITKEHLLVAIKGVDKNGLLEMEADHRNLCHKGRETEENLCKLGFIKVWDTKEESIVLRESIYSDIEQMLEV